jgi:ketosteroid isomerase-like protein
MTTIDNVRGCGDAADREAAWAAVLAVYAGFTAGDRAAIDANLDPDVTIWDSAAPAMAFGLAELDVLRAARREPEGSDPRPRLQATPLVVDVWGDTALVRHVLVVTVGTGRPEVVRTTVVLRRAASGWLAVHNHEDVLAPDVTVEDALTRV